MHQEKRFGKRITEPSAVQIVHELKLMAQRQSLDAAIEREAAAEDGNVPAGPATLTSSNL